MNHPNLPIFHWVYHSRPSLFRDMVDFDPQREFSFRQERLRRLNGLVRCLTKTAEDTKEYLKANKKKKLKKKRTKSAAKG